MPAGSDPGRILPEHRMKNSRSKRYIKMPDPYISVFDRMLNSRAIM